MPTLLRNTPLEVDKRYGPKLRLYNVATANVDVMKLKKRSFRHSRSSPGLS